MRGCHEGEKANFVGFGCNRVHALHASCAPVNYAVAFRRNISHRSLLAARQDEHFTFTHPLLVPER